MDLVQATSVGIRPEAMPKKLVASCKCEAYDTRGQTRLSGQNDNRPLSARFGGVADLARRTALGPLATWSWTANLSAFLQKGGEVECTICGYPA